jgi:hypothetical protein
MLHLALSTLAASQRRALAATVPALDALAKTAGRLACAAGSLADQDSRLTARRASQPRRRHRRALPLAGMGRWLAEPAQRACGCAQRPGSWRGIQCRLIPTAGRKVTMDKQLCRPVRRVEPGDRRGTTTARQRHARR